MELENIDYYRYYNTDTKILEMPDSGVTLPEGGLGKFIFKSMKDNGDKIAQIDPETDVEETYAEVLLKITRTAIQLKLLGIQPGDIVATCSNNHLNNIVPYLVTFLIGGVNTAMDPSFEQNDLAHMLNLVQPKIIFAIKPAKEKVYKVLKEFNLATSLYVFGEDFEEVFLTEKEDESEFVPYYVNDSKKIAAILFSSGSTGFPKGITLSHEFFLYVSRIPATVNAFYTSLFWISAVAILILNSVHGSCRIILNEFDADKLWMYINKYKIRSLYLPPSMAVDFFTYHPKNAADCCLQLMILGGSTVLEEDLNRYINILPNTSFIYTYGLTEIAMTFLPPDIRSYKLGGVGFPKRDIHYKIVDPDTEEVLGFNQPGELRLKTKWMMSGYYKMDSKNVFDKDGFFKTGDVLYYDEDFCFYVVDRIKEMFKYRGWHIIPAKIECVLAKHPDVLISIAVGIPHPTDDHHPMAIVKCKPNSKVTEYELCQFVNEQVDDKHQLRAGVVFVKDFIYTSSQKINRRQTRDMVLNGTIEKKHIIHA